jgi:hypothetical protein
MSVYATAAGQGPVGRDHRAETGASAGGRSREAPNSGQRQFTEGSKEPGVRGDGGPR